MESLKLVGISKRFNGIDALKDVDFEAQRGEFVIFVGPSGCGKSTLLRIIAGLESATSGQVYIDGVEMSARPASERGIAMVFQTYALYPHLTVRGNMSLGLKQAKTPGEEIKARVEQASAMLSLQDLMDRRPAELSGGQRQRVAIGRAIVRHPTLFLFDEPLSNLDAALRVNTRVEIARLHRELKATMVYVTHDQVEAMTLADRLVVLNHGHVEQIGTPMEIYNHPVNTFVAGFIGSPRMNFIVASKFGVDDAHTVGIRPEHIALSAENGDVAGRVAHVEHLGGDMNVYVDSDSVGLVTVRLFGEHDYEIDQPVYLSANPQRVYYFDADGKTLNA